jgi:hypothetical protein
MVLFAYIAVKQLEHWIAVLDSIADGELAMNMLVASGDRAVPYLEHFLLAGSLRTIALPRCRAAHALGDPQYGVVERRENHSFADLKTGCIIAARKPNIATGRIGVWSLAAKADRGSTAERAFLQGQEDTSVDQVAALAERFFHGFSIYETGNSYAVFQIHLTT